MRTRHWIVFIAAIAYALFLIWTFAHDLDAQLWRP